MTWIKLLIGGIMIALSVAIGYVSAAKSRARSKFYAQMYAFNERYLSELIYTRKPLGDLLGEERGDFCDLLAAAAAQRTPEVKLGYLTEEERRETLGYLAMLGRGDSASQSSFFSSGRDALAKKKEECAERARKQTALGVRLGLLAGLALVILIV